MLYRYKFKNFFSFAEEIEVSFELNDSTPKSDLIFKTPRGATLSKLMAVLGSNGSGKTNLIKPLSFIQWFIVHSFTNSKPGDDIPVEAHFFSEPSECEFEIVFENKGKCYRYALTVNQTRVIHEALHVKDDGSFRYVFQRQWSEAQSGYRISQQNFGLIPDEAQKVRPNASLIATGAQYNVPQALELVNYFDRMFTNVLYTGRQSFEVGGLLYAADYFVDHPESAAEMSDILTNLDLGVSKFVIESQEELNKKSGKSETLHIPIGVHKNGKSVAKLPLWRESHGTQTAYVLLRNILPVLERGGVCAVDELELGLHPDMVIAILERFIAPETNPHNGQIIFTCHTLEILNELQKEQFIIVEKDHDGISAARGLNKIKGIRRDENLYAKFRAGAYGGIPNI